MFRSGMARNIPFFRLSLTHSLAIERSTGPPVTTLVVRLLVPRGPRGSTWVAQRGRLKAGGVPQSKGPPRPVGCAGASHAGSTSSTPQQVLVALRAGLVVKPNGRWVAMPPLVDVENETLCGMQILNAHASSCMPRTCGSIWSPPRRQGPAPEAWCPTDRASSDCDPPSCEWFEQEASVQACGT